MRFNTKFIFLLVIFISCGGGTSGTGVTAGDATISNPEDTVGFCGVVQDQNNKTDFNLCASDFSAETKIESDGSFKLELKNTDEQSITLGCDAENSKTVILFKDQNGNFVSTDPERVLETNCNNMEKK